VSQEEGQPASHAPGAAAAEDQRPKKACPDCAELVLAAARKCRYCGYEFRPAPTPTPTGNEGLLSFLLRRGAPRLTMTETLVQFGIELDSGEQPAGMWLGRVQGSDGYVVLTDARLFFVLALRPSADMPKPQQHRLDELVGAEVVTRFWKSALVLHWRGPVANASDANLSGVSMNIDGLVQKDLRQLHALLLARIEGA